jgi:hypothetical protein
MATKSTKPTKHWLYKSQDSERQAQSLGFYNELLFVGFVDFVANNGIYHD